MIFRDICSGCENDTIIQNKKYNLCSECVFKKNHDGKSKEEIYKERADKKPKKEYNLPISYKKYHHIHHQHII